MRVDEVISMLISRSGMSARRISATLGKSQNWATMTAGPGRDPKLSTVVAVADAAGCDLVIIDRETGERLGAIERQ